MPKIATPPELLAPAGDLEKFRTALMYGADAVYLSGPDINLRAGGAAGFTPKELHTALAEAQRAGVRCYFCLNSFPRQENMAPLPGMIERAANAGVDAFIVADPGILRLVSRYAPDVPVHLSTQANTTNAHSIAFWADQGVSRVNLARELSCADMYSIQKAVSRICPQLELEVFVHGSMCLSVSGQCLLSAWLNNRSANEGQCTQPCRFAYRGLALTVEEATRPGDPLWTVTEGEHFSEIWAPDDLCLLHYLPWFIQSGIHSLKIEGRSKSPVYLAHVVDAYATALAGLRAAAQVQRAASEVCLFSHARPKPAEDAAGLARAGICPYTGFTSPHLASGGFCPYNEGNEGRSDICPFMGMPVDRAPAPENREPQGLLLDAPLAAGRSMGPSSPTAAFDPMLFMPELLNASTRPLSSGFFLPGKRRNFSAEALTGLIKAGAAPSRPILAKVAEPADGKPGAWLLEIRGQWHSDAGVELMLPGMQRPKLAPGSYSLENHRGETARVVNSGVKAVLYCDNPDIRPGIFIRGSV